MAAFRGSVECVRSLIASGAEVNLADDADLTPLMVAAIQGCTEVVGRKAALRLDRKDMVEKSATADFMARLCLAAA